MHTDKQKGGKIGEIGHFSRRLNAFIARQIQLYENF
jgi:hypothetical protein